MNRRLRKLAVWSDEREDVRKINPNEKRKRLESLYKNVYGAPVGYENYPRTSLTEGKIYTNENGEQCEDPYSNDPVKREVRFCIGSVQNYMPRYMDLIKNGNNKSSSAESSASVQFRRNTYMSPGAGIGINPAGDTKAQIARFKASVENGHQYIGIEENRRTLPREEKEVRKKADNDHRYKQRCELGIEALN